MQALREDLTAGREFSRDDGPASPAVAIVNETMARRFWQTPARTVGQRIGLGDNDELTIVGVARDIKYFRLNEEPRPYFYMPVAQRFRTEMTVHVRGSAGTADSLGRVRAEVRNLDATVPVLEAHTLADQARAGLALYELSAAALMAFGLIAIGLAAVGVYGLVSYSVKQSTHEIGVRIALGARRRDVVLRFLSRGMRLGLVGAAIGITGALMVTRFMVAVLYGVEAHDLVAFGAAAGVVVATTLLASLLPSWRAASTDPIRALRHP